jgi:hypothetical protein
MNAEQWILVLVNLVLFLLWQYTDRDREKLRLQLAENDQHREGLVNELSRLERMMRASKALPRGWDEDWEEEEDDADS